MTIQPINDIIYYRKTKLYNFRKVLEIRGFMQISSRFSIAVHVLTCIGVFKGKFKLTSNFLASSVNVNPVIIRRILQQLKAAGIVGVTRGSGGAEIIKPLSEITMLDIYNAVECVDSGKLFSFHENPNQDCPVGRNIHNVLDGKLERIQNAMEAEMKSITMADVLSDAEGFVNSGK